MAINYKRFIFHPYQVNTYIIYDEERRDALIIDPACWVSSERVELSQYIAENALKPIAIINTHMHYDHNASNVYFQKLYSIPVWAHSGDDFMLNDPEFMRTRMERIPKEGLGKIDRHLSDGEVLKLGHGELNVIHTPGHSPGGICLHCVDAGFLLSGDTLFYESIGRADLPKSSPKQLLKSIEERLFVLPDKTIVLPGHDEFTSIGHEKRYSPFF